MKSQLLDITIVGTDQIGILAKITTFFADNNININNITQNTMQNTVRLTFSLDKSKSNLTAQQLIHDLNSMCNTMGLEATLQENIVNNV